MNTNKPTYDEKYGNLNLLKNHVIIYIEYGSLDFD